MGQGQRAWPVLLLLLSTVLVPTVCVLWFMGQAMRNERLAVRQKLIEVYRNQLATIPPLLQAHWEDVAKRLERIVPDASPGRRFAEAVTAGFCDSALVYGPSGDALYPATRHFVTKSDTVGIPDWCQAEHIEYDEADAAGAASVYAQIAASADDATLAARALQAQARCLAKAGASDEAIRVLTEVLAGDRYRRAQDPYGRLIAADGLLRALQLMPERDSSRRSSALRALAERLADYDELGLPSNQRRFLMQQLLSSAPAEVSFPTLAAEDLAADYVDTALREVDISVLFSASIGDVRQPGEADRTAVRLRPTHLPGIWSLVSPDRTIVALFRQQTITTAVGTLIGDRFTSADVRVELVAPSATAPVDSPLVAVVAGDALPGWQVVLCLEGSSPLAGAADRRITYYLWSGIAVVIVIAGLALLVTRIVTRQITLTRLKNDLIATVSHELKTPLASMRALVDTLLEGRCHDDAQKREYLELIAKENTRLSRLIDNFLTFSRMERNKRAFEFVDVSPTTVAQAAIDSVRERFDASGCKLEIQIADSLPGVIGDHDALVTVLLNLLDNARKYSENEKHVRLRVFAESGSVCFEVRDEGAGMPRGVTKRIFDRFYQADQNLSRRAGGCGLGLSITKFIVDAHGGRIDVVSRPGQGSMFTVALPAAANDD